MTQPEHARGTRKRVRIDITWLPTWMPFTWALEKPKRVAHATRGMFAVEFARLAVVILWMP